MSPNLTHKCILELLKLSSNVNECKPLPVSTPALMKGRKFNL